MNNNYITELKRMFDKDELQEKFIARTFDNQFRKVGLHCDPDLAKQKPHLAVFHGYEVLTESRFLRMEND